MKSSVRGILIAGATTVVVLVVGLVFVFGVGRTTPPPEPAVVMPVDDSALSLEARRQARLSESQAMLGGGKQGPVVQAIPAEPSPPPPPAPPVDAEAAAAPAQPVAPTPTPSKPVAAPQRGGVAYDKAIVDAKRIERREVIKSGPPEDVVPSAAPPPPVPGPVHLHPCTIATTSDSPVGVACQEGGRPQAKKTMKKLIGAAREHGSRFTCESCHVNLDDYKLREDARTEFAALLEAAK